MSGIPGPYISGLIPHIVQSSQRFGAERGLQLLFGSLQDRRGVYLASFLASVDESKELNPDEELTR